MEVTALIDTGSTVSTVSKSYYEQYLSELPLHPMTEILHIECADGGTLPYCGYIEASITSKGLPHSNLTEYPILVVPDSNYNQKVPVLLGTNILNHLLTDIRVNYGDRYLQTAELHTPWYLAFRSMTLQAKELRKHQNRLGIVRSAELQPVVIPPNSSVAISGYIHKAVPYQTTPAILQATTDSKIPSDLDIQPTVINYNYPARSLVKVCIDNVTTRTVQIQPRSTLCEIQPVVIEDINICNAAQEADNILELIKLERKILTIDQIKRSENLLSTYTDVFSKSDIDIGFTQMVSHPIELLDDTPFKQRPRRIPPAMFSEIKQHLKQLLDGGIIRKSKSSWSSNVVLCRKKNNELRMCVDYRQLNNRTKKDSYALPRVEDILDALSGNKYFTILDMKSGYHQIEVREHHKERTAFTVGPLGFFEYNRMPFGLVNAPATYQRLMEQCFEGLHLDICYIYLDDIIIFSKTFEEHLERVEKVLQRLREKNLKLSPKKCEFFRQQVKYVGNIVSENGIEPDPEKIAKVKEWPTPLNPDEVRRFLGFVGYYRRFIKGFSNIARPLNELLPDTKKKSRKGTKPKPLPSNWKWGPEQEQSFNTLKEKLITYPILGYADYTKPFELHTDASCSSLGAVLYQLQNGDKRVIAYASRSLTKSEKNYPAHKLEFLALKWSVCEKFHDYLYGSKFIVLTDNNPLTYVTTSAKLDATSQRWVAALANYDFELKYRPGSQNADADGLSRIPADSIKAICTCQIVSPYVQCLSLSTSAVGQLPDLSDYAEIDLQYYQQRDPVLRFWIPYVRDNYQPRRHQLPLDFSQQHAAMYRNFAKLKIKDGILVRQISLNEGNKTQIILPKSCIKTVLYHLHTEMGHPGREKTISLIRDRFYWHGMTADIEKYISNCRRCLLRKTPTNERAPLTNIRTSQPLELVCMDYLKLETSKGGYENILVITDHFTRYAQAIVTRNQTAKTTAEALYSNFIVHYGIPLKLHSDQGAQFESNIIRELCSILGIEKSRTTPYHPMGNGLTERFNRTLIQMLGTLENHQKQDWKSYISSLVHAYNSMRQETTGQSPFFLMFGREPKLPVDIIFNTNDQDNPGTLRKYIANLKLKLENSYKLAKESTEKAQKRQKRNYDIKVRGAVIQPGDRVLVKIVAFDGRHKLSDKWEEEPYIVHFQPNTDIPVYVVKRENNAKIQRTLHRNLLLPIGHLDEFKPEINKPRPKPAPRKLKPITREAKKDQKQDQSDSESSYEFEGETEDIANRNEGTPVSVEKPCVTPAERSQPVNTPDVEKEGATTALERDEARAPTDESEEAEVHVDPVTDASEDTEENEELRTHIKDADSNNATALPDTSTPAGIKPHLDCDSTDEEIGENNAEGQRKSRRTRDKPAWMKRGDYFINQQIAVPQPEWKIRADYLKSLANDPTFNSHSEAVTNALIDIVAFKP